MRKIKQTYRILLQQTNRAAICFQTAALKGFYSAYASSPMATLTAFSAKVMVRPMAMPGIRQG